MQNELWQELWDRTPAALTGLVYSALPGVAAVLAEGDRVERSIGAGASVAGTCVTLWLWCWLAARAARGSVGDERAVRSGMCGKCGGERFSGGVCAECGTRVPAVTA